jgi:RimJ/RimL family protein N-acetyltransferase
MEFTIIKAREKKHFEDAKHIFMLYQQSLGFDLCFQGFQKELDTIEQHYNDNDGGIFIAYDHEKPIATIALRRINTDTGEVKRMFNLPEYRGKGLGQTLITCLIDLAKNLHYRSIKLDTLSHMKAALHIYKSNDFHEIESYTYNPLESVIYMEKIL